MTDYLVLIHGREARDLSPQQLGAHLARWNAWIEELRAQARLKDAAPLAEEVRCLRAGQVTDGPFAETKDIVSGYLVLTAEDLNAATVIAQGCPAFEVGGWVEVREIEAG